MQRLGIRHLLTFLTVVIVLMTATVLFTHLQPDYTNVEFDFFSMQDNEAVALTGLDRKQVGSIKFGFLKHFEPPRVGVFGNHQFMHFGKQAFGDTLNNGDFFNFWYANLGLPEVLHSLAYLDSINKLPKDLIVVQITTPNNDMGRHIIDWGGELPDSFVNSNLLKQQGTLHYLDWFLFHYIKGKIKTIFDFNKLRSVYANLTAPPPAELLKQQMVKSNDTINGKPISRAFSSDGSFRQENFTKSLVRDGDSNIRGQVIFWGDEQQIAYYMQAINDLCAKAGRKVVFVIPPVYESERDTEVDRIFNKGISKLSGVSIIDHRGLPKDEELFMLFDHPGNKYFEVLAQHIVNNGLIH